MKKLIPASFIFINIAFITYILWASDFAHRCIDEKMDACRNSSGWLETFNVLGMMGALPFFIAFLIWIMAVASIETDKELPWLEEAGDISLTAWDALEAKSKNK